MTIDATPYPEHHKFLITPEADALAELYLIRGDLRQAQRTLSLYFEKYAYAEGIDQGDFATISSSLFRDGILLFCACFSTSDPNKLNPKSTFGHLEDWEAYCQRLLDIRDSFVAHNFGPARQHHIVVIALEADGELVPAGFVEVFMRFAGWIAAEGNQLLQYVEVALEHVAARIEDAEQPVYETVAAITADELAALPDAELTIPDNRDLRSSRAAFRAHGRGERRPLPPRRWVQTIEGELDSLRSNQPRDNPNEGDVS